MKEISVKQLLDHIEISCEILDLSFIPELRVVCHSEEIVYQKNGIIYLNLKILEQSVSERFDITYFALFYLTFQLRMMWHEEKFCKEELNSMDFNHFREIDAKALSVLVLAKIYGYTSHVVFLKPYSALILERMEDIYINEENTRNTIDQYLF